MCMLRVLSCDEPHMLLNLPEKEKVREVTWICFEEIASKSIIQALSYILQQLQKGETAAFVN